MNFPRIALRGSPTTIQQLYSLGRFNSKKYVGKDKDCLYYLNSEGNIDASYSLPEGYKIISHISELKSTKLFKLL